MGLFDKLFNKDSANVGTDSATYGSYRIVKETNKSITVINQDGETCTPTKRYLREIADAVGLVYSNDWNTQTFGAKLINFLNENIGQPANKPSSVATEDASDKKKFRIELFTKGSYDIEVAPIDTDEYDIEDMSFDEAVEYIMDDGDYIGNFAFSEGVRFELKVYNESDEVVYESNDFEDFKFYESDSHICDEDDFETDVDLQNFAKEVGSRYNEELNEIESGTYIAQYHEIKWMKHTFMVEDYEFDADKLIFVGNGTIAGLVSDGLTDYRHMYYDYKLLEAEDEDVDYDEYGSSLYAVEKRKNRSWREISEFE